MITWNKSSKWEYASNVVRFSAKFVFLETKINITYVLYSEGGFLTTKNSTSERNIVTSVNQDTDKKDENSIFFQLETDRLLWKEKVRES